MRKGIAAVIAAGLMAGCSGAGIESSTRATVVLSLQDITCQSCGATSVKALEGKDGVLAARFDRDRAEVRVDYDPARTDPVALTFAVEKLGYGATVGAGQGRYASDVAFSPGLDVQWISRGGNAVDIAAHMAPGKVTVFDFYAEWCGPCREVDRDMVSVLTAQSDVALRKIDVADWDSAVARRYLAGVPGLPYVIVYGKDGERIDAISGLHLDRVRAAIRRGGGK